MDFRKMVRLPTMPGKTLIVLATVVLFATALPFYLETHPISVSGLRSSLTALIVLVGSAMLVSVLAWARRRLTGPGFGLICLAVLALFATAIYRRFRQSSLESFGVLALAIAATALHLLMVTAGGAFIARLLRVRRISGLSQVVLSLLVGWTAWGWTAYLLGLAGFFTVFWLGGLSLVFGLLGLPDLAAAARRIRKARRLLLPRGWESVGFWGALVGFTVIACFFARIRSASPPIVYDELMYHLATPKHYLEVGAIDFYPSLRGAYLPSLSQMHYALFIGLGLDVGAKMANLALSAALLVVAFEIGRVLGGRLAGALAAITTAFTPVVLWCAGTAYTDNAFTALGLAAFLFTLQGLRRGRPPLLAAGGVLAGAALFTRYQAVYLVAALAISCLAACALEPPRPGRRLWGALCLAGSLAVAVPLPFWIHNAWWTGNPVYPLLDRVFPSSGWFDAQDLDSFNRANFAAFGYGRSLLDMLACPWRIVIDEHRFDAGEGMAPGFLMLTLIPLAAWGSLRRRRSIPYAMGMVLIFAGWFSSIQVARYLLPALCLLAMLAAAAVAQLLSRRRAPVLAGTTLLALFFLGIQGRGFIGDKELALAGQSRNLYLDAHVPTHRVLREHVARLPRDAVVWAFMDQQAVYYYPRTVLGDHFGHHKYAKIAANVAPFAFLDGVEVMARFDSWRVTHVLLNLPGTPAYRSSGVDPESFLKLKDPVLRDRLELLFAENDLYLYQVLPASPGGKAVTDREEPGKNLIRNPSFEDLRDLSPEGWGTQGPLEIVTEPGGPTAGHAVKTNKGNLVFQCFPVESDSIYLLTCRARSESGGTGYLRIHIIWYAEEKRQIASSVAVWETGPEYRRLVGPFTSPLAAVSGAIYLCGHESSWIRLDEVALQNVKRRTGA